MYSTKPRLTVTKKRNGDWIISGGYFVIRNCVMLRDVLSMFSSVLSQCDVCWVIMILLVNIVVIKMQFVCSLNSNTIHVRRYVGDGAIYAQQNIPPHHHVHNGISFCPVLDLVNNPRGY